MGIERKATDQRNPCRKFLATPLGSTSDRRLRLALVEGRSDPSTAARRHNEVATQQLPLLTSRKERSTAREQRTVTPEVLSIGHGSVF